MHIRAIQNVPEKNYVNKLPTLAEFLLVASIPPSDDVIEGEVSPQDRARYYLCFYEWKFSESPLQVCKTGLSKQDDRLHVLSLGLCLLP